MRALFKLAVGAVIVAACAAAQGQEGLRDRDPVLQGAKSIASDLQTATFHYGPWYLLSNFTLSDLGYGQTYFTPSGESDGGITLGASAPQRLYFVPSRRVVFAASVVPQYAWVQQNGAHNQFGYNTRGDAELLFNHLFLDFYGARANELRPQLGEINRVVTIKEREAGVSAEIKYSSRTSALFTARYRDAHYPIDRLQPVDFRTQLGLLDRTEHGYRLSGIHKTFPLTSILVAAEQGRYAFRNDPTRDARRNYAGIGFVTDTGVTVLRGEAGPASLRYKDPTRKDYSGLIANASVSRRLSDRWRAAINAQHDLDFSIYGNNTYYITDRLGARADFAATRKLSIKFISELGHDRYDLVSPLQLVRRRDTIAWNAIGWEYAMRRFRGGFDVGYYDRRTNVTDAEEANGIRLVLHLSFFP